jgi:GTP pyrophosphokinase
LNLDAMNAVSLSLDSLLASDAVSALTADVRAALREAAAGPATEVGARDPADVVATMLDALAKLDADSDTVAAALLRNYPGLLAALGPAFESAHPAIAVLLEGQAAAAHVAK